MKVEILVKGNTHKPIVNVRMSSKSILVNYEDVENRKHVDYALLTTYGDNTVGINSEKVRDHIYTLIKQDGTANNIATHIQTVMDQLKKEIKEVKEDVVSLGKTEYVYNFDI